MSTTNNTGALAVGLTAVQVPLGDVDVPVIVNNGPDRAWFGSADDVTAANGLPLGVGVGFEFPESLQVSRWDALWIISEGTSNISYASIG